MNFLIDAESKLPSSNDPNPKGGNDPEKARESPPGRIRLFAAPTLFFSLLLLLFFLLLFVFSPSSFFLSFLLSFSLLFSFSFSFFFPCFLFSIANGDPLFESRILIYIYICVCVCTRTADGNRAVVLAKPGTTTSPVNEARATFSIPSSVLRFYLRYVCLSVYSGPYANYTKGLSHPPSAFPENTHVHVRSRNVSSADNVDNVARTGLTGKRYTTKSIFLLVDGGYGEKKEFGKLCG